jgi:lipopolysaccharide/colanic/teichoic acid biosynthesis glycosyltransferase
MIKRSFDVLGSLLAIFLLLVPFIMLTLFLSLFSHRPVFFTQKRIGKDGHPFKIIKFRTMYMQSDNTGSITISRDPRVTPIGRFLRKNKLDEFPQLFNVLIGKMSFVGPRPDVPGYANKLEGDDRKIIELRPGITGPASLYFRNEEEILGKVKNPREYNDTAIWPKKVQLNLDYYYHWSFRKDIGYIIITLFPELDRFFKLIR